MIHYAISIQVDLWQVSGLNESAMLFLLKEHTYLVKELLLEHVKSRGALQILIFFNDCFQYTIKLTSNNFYMKCNFTMVTLAYKPSISE